MSAYIGHSAVWNGACQLNEKESPAFHIEKTLDHLVDLELVVLNAGHVLLDSDDGLASVFIAEKPGIQRVVWKPVEKKKGPDNRDGAENEKYSLGTSGIDHDRRTLLSYLPWSNAFDMPNAVRKQPTEDTGDSDSLEPDSMAEGLLRSLVPHRNDDTEARCNGSFSEAEEETDSDDALVVERRRSQHQHCTPDDAGQVSRYPGLKERDSH